MEMAILYLNNDLCKIDNEKLNYIGKEKIKVKSTYSANN